MVLLFCLLLAVVFVRTYFPKTGTGGAGAVKDDFLCRRSNLYTYDEMVQDMDLMRDRYGSLVRIESLGQTADGRELYDIQIGSSAASHSIMINGAIHAREHITSKLVMCQAVDLLEKAETNAFYRGNAVAEMLDDMEIHFVPMLNPDGIALTQSGLEGIRSESVKEKILDIAVQDGREPDKEYFSKWWSNTNGVDLNRNFDALWERFDDEVHHPSYMKYKGAAVESEAETAAIADLIREEQFSAILCYHAVGEVIYWFFRQNGELRKMTEDYAEQLSQITGYRTDINFQDIDPAGLKDWALEKEGIPGFTIEMGTEDFQANTSEFEKIWEANQHVVLETVIAVAEGRLFRIPPRTLDPGELLTVVKCSRYLSLRANPTPMSEELARIPMGAEVTFEAYANDEYYRVSYQGQTGYAMINYLE